MAQGLQKELNARLVDRLDRSRCAAIDGLRHSIDFECLSSALGGTFEMIFVEARRDHRFQRLQSRYSTIEAFDAADAHPAEGHIDELRPRASVTIANEDSLEELYGRLDAWLAARRRGDQQ